MEKSLKIAYQTLPNDIEEGLNKTFHYCFIFNRNKLLAIGQNYSHQINNKVVKFAKRWGIDHWKKHPFFHAELDAISKLWGKYYIDHSLKFVILRLNKLGELRNSRPCKHCQVVLTALGINKIWFSNKNGIIQCI